MTPSVESYRPTHGGYPGREVGAERFPGLAVDDGRLGDLVARSRDDEAQADALAYLLGDCYPGGSWSA